MTVMRRTILTLSLASAVFAQSGAAQTPAASPAPVAYANLNQLMRGVFYPAANVVFFPQFENPGDVKQDLDPSLSTDPLKATFGQWQAVENAALARRIHEPAADSANVLDRRSSADDGSGVGEVRERGPRRRDAGVQGRAGERSRQDQRAQ